MLKRLDTEALTRTVPKCSTSTTQPPQTQFICAEQIIHKENFYPMTAEHAPVRSHMQEDELSARK